MTQSLRPSTYILFDIDGTLINTGGAGLRAMKCAVGDVLQNTEVLDGYSFAGKTDAQIIRDMVRRTLADTADTDVLARRVIDSYVHNLSGALRDSDSYRLYPHAVEVLNRCAADTTVECALLTGNIREGARLKLEHGGLWDYFSWGVFGDISEERTHLAESARSIILEKNPAAAMRNIIIVGDTSNDILCAKAISATSVAFSGGFEAEHTLREQEPDYLIDDLIRIMDILGRT